MKELGIVFLTQSSQEIQLMTKDQMYKLSSYDINKDFIRFIPSSNTAGLLTSSSTSKKMPGLTAPATKMAKLLHQLLIHLHNNNNLPTLAPTMNPINPNYTTKFY